MEVNINVGIISIYPPKSKKHSPSGGVASYTKNLVQSISPFISRVTVYSNVLTNRVSYKEENNVTVIRCWTPVLYPFQIIREVLKRYQQEDLFHIQFEYFLFGGVISLILFPFLIVGLKLLNKPVVLTIHQVMPISRIDSEFIHDNGFRGFPPLLRYGIRIFTRFIGNISDVIIVHEKLFKDRLVKEYGLSENKISVVPHGIETTQKTANKHDARELIGIPMSKRVILYMGYLSGYKGVDILVDAFKHLNDNYILLLGGGLHPRLKKDPEYIKHVRDLENVAKKSLNIRFVGFIPENHIPLYFSACDVVVFPYKAVFGSSGPMSIAISYKKPLLASREFNGIIPQEFTFELTPGGIKKAIYNIFNDRVIVKNSLKFVLSTLSTRKWENIGKKTAEVYLNVIRSESNRGGN